MELISNEIHTTSENIYYDLFDGWYLKPKIYLQWEDLKKVTDAMSIIEEFITLLDENELIDRM